MVRDTIGVGYVYFHDANEMTLMPVDISKLSKKF